MKEQDRIVKEITAFRDCNKFQVYQSLQPAVENSTPDTIALITGIFNNACNKLLEVIETGGTDAKVLKGILLETTNEIESQHLDTEDYEFAYELILVLGNILNITIAEEIRQREVEKIEEFKKLIEKGGFDPNSFGMKL